MEGPRLGVQSELQLPAYPTGTAMQDPSHICDLHHSSGQRRILNPLSKTRDRTRNPMVSPGPQRELRSVNGGAKGRCGRSETCLAEGDTALTALEQGQRRPAGHTFLLRGV